LPAGDCDAAPNGAGIAYAILIGPDSVAANATPAVIRMPFDLIFILRAFLE
jgi:hypothetical protein